LFRYRADANLGTHETKTLSDKWTVITLDGKPSAHVEHTVAVTPEGPEILTLSKAQKALLNIEKSKPPLLDLKNDSKKANIYGLSN
jgi:hypothetical protein